MSLTFLASSLANFQKAPKRHQEFKCLEKGTETTFAFVHSDF